MLRTLEAVIDEQGNVRLLDLVQLPAPHRALVTILDEPAASEERPSHGARMVAALEALASLHALDDIGDPAQWERDMRQDRPLPDREE